MRVKDLQIGEMYFSKSHQLMMKYCGVEYFRGRKYHNFYESSWRLFHWLHPQDVSLPNNASTRPLVRTGKKALSKSSPSSVKQAGSPSGS